MALKAHIIRIGNSRGLRLPKQVLTEAGLGDEVELEVQRGSVIVRPTHHARSGWDAQFHKMAERGDDRLLDADEPIPTRWDQTEWEW